MNKSIFVEPLVSWRRRFAFILGRAVKINFLTRTDNVILPQMSVSNSISDTGERRPTDLPEKQKTITRYKFFSWNEHTGSVYNQWKNRTPSCTTLNCHIFSLPFTVLGVCAKLCISTTLLQGRISLASVAGEPFKNILIYLCFCSLVLHNMLPWNV